MHSKGIMHRDIKPEKSHIIKTWKNDMNVKIADFGLATMVNPSGEYLFQKMWKLQVMSLLKYSLMLNMIKRLMYLVLVSFFTFCKLLLFNP